jgi:ankyrin repeat protein
MNASQSIFACMMLLFIAEQYSTAQSPLADAAERNNAASVRSLLVQKVDVTVPQADGMTALHWATYHDELELASELIAAGADVKAANRYGVTSLALACTNGNGSLVRLLLDSGADANCELPGGETALMTASRTGKLTSVKLLLENGAKIDAQERKGQTALMWAAAEGHLDVVDALLKAGADRRVTLQSGFTAFFFAVREGRKEVAFRLLKEGEVVNDLMRPKRGGKLFSPLLLAIENGHFELADALLKAGADPDEQPAGYAALHAISWVRKPIRGDGDPPPRGSGAMTSLDLVRSLAAHHADVNARTKKGDSGRGRFTTIGATPFLLASRTGDVSLMQLLLELKADPSLPNADGSSPLLAASGVGALGDGDEAAATEEEALEAVKLLLDLGADINAKDKNGETAMHGAAYQSLPKLVKMLADRGADIRVWNQKNKWEWTPLMIAEGHRPGNFRPAPETIAAIEGVMKAAGVTPPPKVKAANRPVY